MLLELKDVTFSYRGKYRTVPVLKGVTCSFSAGQVCGIVGKSGSGKSTLLSLMAGLALPEEGTVLADGVSTKDCDLEDYRRDKVAMIYQSFRLLPLLTVEENVMFPMELRGVGPKEAQKRAKALLREVDLPQELAGRFPETLSGGEQQRVAIARALACDTKLLLADEPTGNLDSDNSERIVALLRKLASEHGYCVIIVTHDVDIMGQLDVVYRMRDGRLV